MEQHEQARFIVAVCTSRHKIKTAKQHTDLIHLKLKLASVMPDKIRLQRFPASQMLSYRKRLECNFGTFDIRQGYESPLSSNSYEHTRVTKTIIIYIPKRCAKVQVNIILMIFGSRVFTVRNLTWINDSLDAGLPCPSFHGVLEKL